MIPETDRLLQFEYSVLTKSYQEKYIAVVCKRHSSPGNCPLVNWDKAVTRKVTNNFPAIKHPTIVAYDSNPDKIELVD